MKVLGTLVLFFFASFTQCIMKTNQRERLIMIKEMLIKGGAIVTGIIISQVIIEKLEKRSLKRNEVTEEMNSEEGKETTEKEKWAKLRPRVVETIERHRKAE